MENQLRALWKINGAHIWTKACPKMVELLEDFFYILLRDLWISKRK
ncbi:MAG: hypothetical protein ACOC35_09745 [Promethearchaeia archaeon]